MKHCTHLKRFDVSIDAPKGSRPACLICEDCLEVVAKSLRLHLNVMWDAEDDTNPDIESGVRMLLYDLAGERAKKPRRGLREYNREYQRKRRAKRAMQKVEGGRE
jgi:hypothetical protein